MQVNMTNARCNCGAADLQDHVAKRSAASRLSRVFGTWDVYAIDSRQHRWKLLVY